MKRKIYLLCACALVLTGCGNKKTDTNSVTSMPVSLEVQQDKDALAKLQKMSEKSLIAKKVSKTVLQKKYPDWLTKSGDIKYPVRPGDKKWEAAKTQNDLYELSDIPKEIVDSVDTETLLKAVEEHPLLSQPYDIWSVGMEAFSRKFYGLKILLQREDAGIEAASVYMVKDMKEIVEKENSNEDKKQVQADEDYHKIVLEEYLISAEKTYEQMDDTKKQQVLKAIKANYEYEKEIASNAGAQEYHFYDMIKYGDNPWKK